jgi:hypothetical protein
MPYFECLHCGIVTPVEITPPKCSSCGHGTGVVHQNKPSMPDRAAEKQQQQQPRPPGAGRAPVKE